MYGSPNPTPKSFLPSLLRLYDARSDVGLGASAASCHLLLSSPTTRYSK